MSNLYYILMKTDEELNENYLKVTSKSGIECFLPVIKMEIGPNCAALLKDQIDNILNA